FVHKEPNEIALTNKLEDLTYIYEKLIYALQDNYIDSEDQLQLLAEKISETTLLDDAEIYLDGFHGFTPQELLVVESLLKKCKCVPVTLTVERPDDTPLAEMDFFYQTTEPYHRLRALANENGIPSDETVVLDPAFGRFQERAYLGHLERN